MVLVVSGNHLTGFALLIASLLKIFVLVAISNQLDKLYDGEI